MKKNSKSVQYVILLILVAGLYLFDKFDATENIDRITDNSRIEEAIANQQSDVQVEAYGTIVKVLPDDTVGSQHQRLLVKLDSGNVVLIAHNIDLAPRVENLQKGEKIRFYGEFEWNDKGGVVHWTHHDPRNKHPAGWIEYRGKKYG